MLREFREMWYVYGRATSYHGPSIQTACPDPGGRCCLRSLYLGIGEKNFPLGVIPSEDGRGSCTVECWCRWIVPSFIQHFSWWAGLSVCCLPHDPSPLPNPIAVCGACCCIGCENTSCGISATVGVTLCPWPGVLCLRWAAVRLGPLSPLPRIRSSDHIERTGASLTCGRVLGTSSSELTSMSGTPRGRDCAATHVHINPRGSHIGGADTLICSLVLHAPHAREALPGDQENCRRQVEHASQKISPHTRQWCFRVSRENCLLQARHAWRSLSGTGTAGCGSLASNMEHVAQPVKESLLLEVEHEALDVLLLRLACCSSHIGVLGATTTTRRRESDDAADASDSGEEQS